MAPAASSLPIRIVTATSLFDGHDAAINVMRRLLQLEGAEVIHLGHNRSVLEFRDAAIQVLLDELKVRSTSDNLLRASRRGDPTGDTQQAMSARQALLARARATQATGGPPTGYRYGEGRCGLARRPW